MTDEAAPPSSRGYLRSLVALLKKWAPYTPAATDEGLSSTRREHSGELIPSGERRVIMRPEEEAADGQVAAVQAALRNGWRLVDIDLRTEEGERRLAFVLRHRNRPAPPSGG
jgi:hypothetical protein